MKLTEKTFEELGINKDIATTLQKQGITEATEIQAKTIPASLKGKDLIGRAQTGSGKTLAFCLPIIQELQGKTGKGVKALILAPTRELAKQVDEVVKETSTHNKIHTAIIYGGVGYERQYEDLKRADIVVGTPGRIIDHIKQGTLDISGIEFFVLDEADRMLDMGFIDDIKYVIQKTPPHKQNFFFSATMPGAAKKLAESFMHDPVMMKTAQEYVSKHKLEQYYIDCPTFKKPDALRMLFKEEEPELALVFTNTRHMSDKIARYLNQQGTKAKALHGGHSQNKRERVKETFEKGKVDVLVATDVAARGLDIDDITHVVNYDVPKEEQTYTHRIGRTARAGKTGKAFTLLDREEHRMFARIEGDHMREIMKYELKEEPKRVSLGGGRRQSGGRGRRKGGSRKGGKRRKGGRKGGRKRSK